MTAIITWRKRYVGGDTPSEIFESLCRSGEHDPHTVVHGLETAVARFENIAAEARGHATAAADGDESQGPLHLWVRMALQFEHQAERTQAALAFLRGDDEPEQP